MYFDQSCPLPQAGSVVNGYVLIRMINNTDNSIIYKAQDSNGHDVALKFIKVKPTNQEMIEKEIDLMREINSPLILQSIDSFNYPPFKCIVMPFSQAGDLKAYMERTGRPYDENTVRRIMKCALAATYFLHSHSIWHRDIKANNLLFFDSKQTVKLCDLGYATKHRAGEKSEHYLGTIQCAAPEIIANIPYDERVDIWSLGVLMYTLLSGSNPFPSFSGCTMRTCISHGSYFYPERSWKKISPLAKNLIDSMLKVDPSSRISLQDALSHPWFQNQ